MLHRLWRNTWRDPYGIIQISTIGIGAGIISGLVYQGCGERMFGDNPSSNSYFYTDFSGPCFMSAADPFTAISLNKVL